MSSESRRESRMNSPIKNFCLEPTATLFMCNCATMCMATQALFSGISNSSSKFGLHPENHCDQCNY